MHSVLNEKVLEGAFNQEKALVGAFSVIVKTNGTFAALICTEQWQYYNVIPNCSESQNETKATTFNGQRAKVKPEFEKYRNGAMVMFLFWKEGSVDGLCNKIHYFVFSVSRVFGRVLNFDIDTFKKSDTTAF